MYAEKKLRKEDKKKKKKRVEDLPKLRECIARKEKELLIFKMFC